MVFKHRPLISNQSYIIIWILDNISLHMTWSTEYIYKQTQDKTLSLPLNSKDPKITSSFFPCLLYEDWLCLCWTVELNPNIKTAREDRIYARAGMLQFRLSLSRQSNPSTLTTGLLPKLARTHPPFLEEDEGDGGRPDAVGTTTHDCGERGENVSSPNRASWIKGLVALLGGDPQKNGGEEAATGHECSTSKSLSLLSMLSRGFEPEEVESHGSTWQLRCHRKFLTGWSLTGKLKRPQRPTRRGLGQTTLISSCDGTTTFWMANCFIFLLGFQSMYLITTKTCEVRWGLIN